MRHRRWQAASILLGGIECESRPWSEKEKDMKSGNCGTLDEQKPSSGPMVLTKD